MLLNAALPELASALIGRWHVRRVVRDFAGSAGCVFSGEALLTDSGFSEEGEMRVGDRALPASRAYRLERQDGCVLVFRGAELFIRLGGAPSQIVHHQCGDDLYIGRFIFRSDEWVEAWRVKGPRKNYASVSRFRRIILRT
ncbi:hypothetical protein FJ987_11045 [Mesorhizobium sp. CU2]|uniref:DUF6314 family protein n=1 Tax=unclassified Mesorhizobium TaxID=325217 RepID=UPI0011298C40|nr:MULTISPECIES: DUF6314 family protein [unclassified Mesorhizobium]TPN78553.1 hypothetical protein FJ988_24205 [Mesorhizobium sp. CU3]TPO15999.1 hypothetical protein FJ987_11045 [Mesorhizobium sp. CU2]